MKSSEKIEFCEMLATTIEALRGKSPNESTISLWWNVLSTFPIEEVRMGFDEYVRHGKFPPVPSDILEAIEKSKPDGRPTADEAWAMVPRDEATTVVLNDEIAEAMGTAQPLLDAGDQVGARMAFRDAYTRCVEVNRRAGKAPRWFPSLGQDNQCGRLSDRENDRRLDRIESRQSERQIVFSAAAQKGKLSISHKANFLPAPETKNSIAKLLKGTVVNFPVPLESAKSKVAALREILNKENQK